MKIAVTVIRAVLSLIYSLLKLLPVQDKITFISRQGDEPSLDFKMLRDKINEVRPEYKTVFLCKMLHKSVAGMAGYAFHMLRQMYHIATSRAVILDSYCIVISLLKHRDSLLVIQMWHSVGTMKKFGWSVVDEAEGSSRVTAESMRMHRGYSYVLASGEAYKDHLAMGFDFDREKIVTLPLPRVEALQDSEYAETARGKIFDRYPSLDSDRKNIVYVPTFRKDDPRGETEGVRQLIEHFDCGKFNLIIKLHPLSRASLRESGVIDDRVKKLMEEGTLIIDSDFTSMVMLFISDIVISDYSCIIYEAAVLDKPLYFYVYDYDDYTEKRDMYIDFEGEMPGPIEKSAADLMEDIEDDLDNSSYDLDKLRAFREKYVRLTGHETKDIADFIFGKIS